MIITRGYGDLIITQGFGWHMIPEVPEIVRREIKRLISGITREITLESDVH